MASSEPAQSIRRTVVRRARSLGYTAYRLAAEAGVSESQVYRYFAGTSDLSGRRIDRLFRVLDLRVYPIHSPPRPTFAVMRVRVNARVPRSWRGRAGGRGRGPAGTAANPAGVLSFLAVTSHKVSAGGAAR